MTKQQRLSITDRMDEVFRGAEKLTKDERQVIEETMYAMVCDVELGMDYENVISVWAAKLMGIIEFLSACGRIDEKEEEDLCMMVNEIEAGRYT